VRKCNDSEKFLADHGSMGRVSLAVFVHLKVVKNIEELYITIIII
jgi:hypothetical protein